MKNVKIIIVMLILALSSQVFAGIGAGNGGGHLKFLIMNKGKKVLEVLRESKTAWLRENNIDMSSLEASLNADNIKIVSVLKSLLDNRGSIVDATANFGEGMTFDKSAMEEHFQNGRDVYYLIFHEMLRTSGYSRQDNNYELSKVLYPFPNFNQIRETQEWIIVENIQSQDSNSTFEERSSRSSLNERLASPVDNAQAMVNDFPQSYQKSSLNQYGFENVFMQLSGEILSLEEKIMIFQPVTNGLSPASYSRTQSQSPNLVSQLNGGCYMLSSVVYNTGLSASRDLVETAQEAINGSYITIMQQVKETFENMPSTSGADAQHFEDLVVRMFSAPDIAEHFIRVSGSLIGQWDDSLRKYKEFVLGNAIASDPCIEAYSLVAEWVDLFKKLVLLEKHWIYLKSEEEDNKFVPALRAHSARFAPVIRREPVWQRGLYISNYIDPRISYGQELKIYHTASIDRLLSVLERLAPKIKCNEDDILQKVRQQNASSNR